MMQFRFLRVLMFCSFSKWAIGSGKNGLLIWFDNGGLSNLLAI